jgi:excisionase family DNA binding protein
MAMTRTVQAHAIISADIPERPQLSQIARLLDDAEDAGSVLVVHGEVREALPRAAAVALRAIVESLADGTAIALVPLDRQLRTQEAADLLGVSRPHLVRLLEQGEISFTWTGRQRRVRLQGLLAYKALRDGERRKHLDELMRLSEEFVLYDD